ncbi:MAG: hypothetical protein OEW56_09825 [Gemmatimonadota bacterium]|nr:hypothetical protein [Gemmatimonadota bacterium]
MRAIVARKPGAPEVLEIVEAAEPEVRDGEVKIRVHAFGLNKAERYYRAGNYGIFSPELALGYEAVGEVVEDSTCRTARGQRVSTAMGGMMTQRQGGYAEFIAVNASCGRLEGGAHEAARCRRRRVHPAAGRPRAVRDVDVVSRRFFNSLEW